MAKNQVSKLKETGTMKLRILITNDDGINSPGLKVAEAVAEKISSDIWVVAPETDQSGTAHSLTLHEPIRLHRISPKRFAVRGTPTDCVIIALTQILKDQKPPDLLISGVNRGTNIGEDVTYSGTLAAAMEGMLSNVPSVALSQGYNGANAVKWSTAEEHASGLLLKLIKAGWPKNVFINMNFPDVEADDVSDIVVTKQGRRDFANVITDERMDTRNVPYYWIGFRRQIGEIDFGPETDLAVIWQGGISITPMQVDLTDKDTKQALAEIF